jgi:predicted CopG family antitoxin
METTTIAIAKNVKEEMSQFGNKSESYSDIIMKLIKSAKERQLHDLLMNEEGCISIEEALANAKKRWRE